MQIEQVPLSGHIKHPTPLHFVTVIKISDTAIEN